MKLYELMLREYDVKVSPAMPTSDMYGRLSKGTGEFIGQGKFADVYGNDTNPHDVMKISKSQDQIGHSSLDVDGYTAFLQAIANDKEMQDNPHFPRIRQVRMDKDNKQFQARVERLTPLQKLSPRELYELIRRYWPTAESKLKYLQGHVKLIKNSDKEDLRDRVENFQTSAENSIVDLVQATYNGNTQSSYKELNTALDWLYATGHNTNFQPDLHRFNIMIRRSNTGNTLVLNDPLGYPNIT